MFLNCVISQQWIYWQVNYRVFQKTFLKICHIACFVWFCSRTYKIYGTYRSMVSEPELQYFCACVESSFACRKPFSNEHWKYPTVITFEKPYILFPTGSDAAAGKYIILCIVPQDYTAAAVSEKTGYLTIFRKVFYRALSPSPTDTAQIIPSFSESCLLLGKV